MKNPFHKNLFLKLLALFLALIMWGYVRYTQTSWSQMSSQGLVEVPLTIENVEPGLVVMDASKTVTLNVRGRPDAFEDMRIADFAAYLDLRGKSEGPYNLRAEIKLPKGIKLEDIPKVSVNLDKLTTKRFEVKVRTIGTLPEGRLLKGFNIVPSKISITGPRSLVDEVRTVEAAVNLSIAENILVVKSMAIPFNKSGMPVDKIECFPKFVSVEVRVQSDNITKTLHVNPVIVGESDSELKSKKVIVNPSTVTVSFRKTPEKSPEYVYTRQIDLRGKNTGFMTEVELIPPSGGMILGNKTVKIKIFKNK